MKETRLKILQYVTGIGLLFFAGWHLWFSHIGHDSKDVSEWESVAERASSAGWLIFYIAFILFVVYHGLHGLRAVILEWFSVPDRSVKVLDSILLVVGIGVIGYAAYIPLDTF